MKRQRAKEKYAAIPADKKSKLNAKKRENYHRGKAEREAVSMVVETPVINQIDGSNVDLNTPDELGTDNLDNSWLHHNYSYARTAMDDIDATYALPGRWKD
ncbi:hypothetical protein PAHAL_2G204700 [Panicum hallii]|uniref:Uncharacterized protein n=1 Tax=Panicum hallii TaxID=206008 RepID=A0A2T8KPP7_9POAL|nr:hypothetical protein PAHAL_2G204700 [Panicum hallii]